KVISSKSPRKFFASRTQTPANRWSMSFSIKRAKKGPDFGLYNPPLVNPSSSQPSTPQWKRASFPRVKKNGWLHRKSCRSHNCLHSPEIGTSLSKPCTTPFTLGNDEIGRAHV